MEWSFSCTPSLVGPDCSLGNPVLQAVIHQLPHPQVPHFLSLCLTAAHCPSWGRAGCAQVSCMCAVMNPHSPRCPGELLRAQTVAVAARSCHQLGPFRGVWPQGNRLQCHLCSTSCLCPAGALLHCLGCFVYKKYGASKDWLCCLAGGRRINQVPFLLYLLAIHFYSRLCSRQQWNF